MKKETESPAQYPAKWLISDKEKELLLNQVKQNEALVRNHYENKNKIT